MPEDAKTLQDRAIRLFTFLKDLTELRTTTVRTLDDYEKVIWLCDIPREPNCHCAAFSADPRDDDSADVWVEVNKPDLSDPPEVPAALRPWLSSDAVNDSSRDFPELSDSNASGDGSAEGPEPTLHVRVPPPEIKALWEEWVEHKWWPWAEKDRRDRKVQQVYSDLFSMFQRQQMFGETYEVVMGIGLLTWRTPSGQTVRRHLVTAHTSLTFDAARGVITLGPAGQGGRPSLEQEMLEADERPHGAMQAEMQEMLDAIGDRIWDRQHIGQLLKTWVHAVSPHGQYVEEMDPPAGEQSHPRVHFAPAIILRRRTERSLIQTFQEIVAHLRDGAPIPAGVQRLVSIVDDGGLQRSTNELDEDKHRFMPTVDDVYFPRPANDEQRSIVEAISSRQGVVVQGPPGTGKSHTIANLVCHLLATGKRVLVTSHTARALRVLHGKIPAAVRALCVSVLGDDQAALRAVEQSVQAITGRLDGWSPSESRRRIAELERQLAEAREEEARATAQIRRRRESETYSHSPRFGTYEGTAAVIAQRLREEEALYGWIEDLPDERFAPPLADAEARELLNLLRCFDPEREAEARLAGVDPDSLSSPDEFATLAKREKQLRLAWDGVKDHVDESVFPAFRRASPADREALARGLDALRAECDALHRRYPWAARAASDVLAGRDGVWRALWEETKQQVEWLEPRAREIQARRVVGVEGRDRRAVKADASALLQHLEAGKWRGLGPIRPRPVKQAMYLLQDVRVDGKRCDQPNTLRELLEWIEGMDRLDELAAHWDGHVERPSGFLAGQVALYRNVCEELASVLHLRDQVAALRQLWRQFSGLAEPRWHDLDELHRLKRTIDAVSLAEEIEHIDRRIGELTRKLQAAVETEDAHPAVGGLLAAAEDRDPHLYRHHYEGLLRWREQRRALERRNHLLARLNAVAPRLAARLRTDCSDPSWDERMASFAAAWNWARANGWLKEWTEPQLKERLSRAITEARERILHTIEELAAAKAWEHCLARMGEEQRQHLLAWSMAIRRSGKGKGKYASQHRRDAREHMEKCRSAIPAWIMPIYRVAETIRPGAETFDVVIVDEASQSGPEALFLQYLGRKLVVVGDDQQISPEFVGLDRDKVALLRERYLSDLPHADTLGVDHSLFDHAVLRYGGKIRLREHFRCMPEIIQSPTTFAIRTSLWSR